MTRRYTEAELIDAIPPLTRERLLHYTRLRIVTPMQGQDAPAFREIDVTRVSLLCELTDDMDLNEDALVIVMSLLDQLHGTRARLDTVMHALSVEEHEVRHRIARRLVG